MDVLINTKYVEENKDKKGLISCIRNIRVVPEGGYIIEPLFIVAAGIGTGICLYQTGTIGLSMAAMKWIAFLAFLCVFYMICCQYDGRMPYIRKVIHILGFPFIIENKGEFYIVDDKNKNLLTKTFTVKVKTFADNVDSLFYIMKDSKVIPICEFKMGMHGKHICSLSFDDIDTACKEAFHMGAMDSLRWKKSIDIYMGYIENQAEENVAQIFPHIQFRIPVKYVNVDAEG